MPFRANQPVLYRQLTYPSHSHIFSAYSLSLRQRQRSRPNNVHNTIHVHKGRAPLLTNKQTHIFCLHFLHINIYKHPYIHIKLAYLKMLLLSASRCCLYARQQQIQTLVTLQQTLEGEYEKTCNGRVHGYSFRSYMDVRRFMHVCRPQPLL